MSVKLDTPGAIVNELQKRNVGKSIQSDPCVNKLSNYQIIKLSSKQLLGVKFAYISIIKRILYYYV